MNLNSLEDEDEIKPYQNSSSRKVDGFDFSAHIALQVDMFQVVAFKDCRPGDLLPETLQAFGQSVFFFHLCQVSKSVNPFILCILSPSGNMMWCH